MAASGLFGGPGKIRELLRGTDWSRTPLGPVEAWPKALVGYVEMILAMPTPAVMFWGPQQTQLYNDGYAAIMGPRHPKYFGSPYRDCWPDTYPTIQPFMDEVLRGGIAQFDKTLFTLTRYGFTEEAYFTFTFSALRDDDGRIAGIFQPVVEVTESVLQERRARMSSALSRRAETANACVDDALAAFAANAHDVPFAAIFLCSDADGRLELVGRSGALDGCGDDALARLVGEAYAANEPREVTDVTEAIGVAPIGPWGDPTRSAFVVPVRRASGVACGALALGVSPRLHFDAAYRRFLESTADLFGDALERALLVEREHAARRELELQKERLSQLFLQAPVSICLLRGPTFVIELANLRICGNWRRAREDVLGRPVFEALPELRRQGLETLLADVRRTGEPYIGKEMVLAIQGPGDEAPKERFFDFVYEPLRNSAGETESVLVVAVDVTDDVRARRKLAELRDAAERENRSKDEFLAMLGHELRNPLAPIVSALQIVRRQLPPSLADKQLSVMERQTTNLRRIVNDLLEVARVTQGKIELRREPVDAVAVVHRALESASEALVARQHHVTVDAPDGPLWVLADPVRLEQVVVNLLTNAAKYTDPGGRIAVGVRLQHDPGRPPEVELRVCDNGIGITEDLRPRLFQLFQQGQRASDRSQGGLGVGLTVVQRLVELHGGRVEARSAGRGQGSEFVVTLPAGPTSHEAAPATREDAAMPTV
jgi:signal transduction histidine kinase